MTDIKTHRLNLAVLVLVATVACCWCSAAGSGDGKTEAPMIVFVCEHGSVKSLIASEFFNRMAEEKGLPWRSIARGLTPDAEVPQKVADQLKSDGFNVSGYRPEKLQPEDVQHALRTVAIGVDVPGDALHVDHWNDIPPASMDYKAARDRMVSRIEKLISELQTQPRK